MKRVIADSSIQSEYDILNDKMYDFGKIGNYELTVSEDDYSITAEAKSDKNCMPKVTIKTVKENDGYHFVPHVEFPPIDESDDELLLSADYYIQKWVDVGEMVQYIAGFVLKPAEIEEN